MSSIRFLGVAGFELIGPDKRILIDPYLTGNDFAPVSAEEIEAPDLILVSHGAYDHVGDAAAIAKRTGAPIVCGVDVRQKMIDEGVPEANVFATVWGVLVEAAGITVRPVECHHWSTVTLRDGTLVTGTPLAFIVEIEPGISVYHYGDSSVFDMSLFGSLYRPSVGLLGCTLPYELEADPDGDPPACKFVSGEMSPKEAALVAEMLGVDVAVACHYLTLNDEVDAFLAEVAGQPTVA